ncbi:hypothetical protein VIGAN_08160300 [Vigna angularis var. angularis]|uniref:Uncharacterized protein n=1 Tax=Vigna angularis var. angularis TaxID=157739 RepID=A0A0S3SQ99_PHAAN|nr:hypothetical protein VIGAN_08160300 [Vigna angularis var. angularis]
MAHGVREMITIAQPLHLVGQDMLCELIHLSRILLLRPRGYNEFVSVAEGLFLLKLCTIEESRSLVDIMVSKSPRDKALFKHIFNKYQSTSDEATRKLTVAVVTNVVPLQKDKSFCHHHGESSSSTCSPKRSRQGVESSVPLIDGIFSTDYCLGEKVSFNLTDAKREIYKGLSLIQRCCML